MGKREKEETETAALSTNRHARKQEPVKVKPCEPARPAPCYDGILTMTMTTMIMMMLVMTMMMMTVMPMDYNLRKRVENNKN